MVQTISPRELHARLHAGTGASRPVVLDVREPQEIAIARFPGALEIPMGEITGRVAEVPRDVDVVVLCHHGMRSAQVAGFLARQGYDRLANLSGGIDAWSLEVDPQVPRY